MATTKKTVEKKPTKKTTEKTTAKKTTKKVEKPSVEKPSVEKKTVAKKTTTKKAVKEAVKELSVSTFDSKLTIKYGDDEIVRTSMNSKVYFFEDILKQKVKEKCVVALTIYGKKTYIVVDKHDRHLRKSPAAVADLLTTVAAQRKKIIKELEG